MKVGFIGLGNVGGKLAGGVQRNGFALTIRDLDRTLAQPFLDRGADWAESPGAMARAVDVVVTCLPSPAASAAVMEAEDGILSGLSPGRIWLEMSTTDEAEVRRLGALVEAAGAVAMDCPVSGGCHRAATGNISIFAGGAERYDSRAWSSMIARRHEDACGMALRAPGFPAELVDDEPEAPGREITVAGRTAVALR